jgi:peptide/nickel transport system substrate-binding protein
MNLNRYFLFPLFILLLISGCGTEQKKSNVIIGISSDPESLNPLYSFSGYEMAISEALYPSLVQHHWDNEKGTMASTPLLAEKLEWAQDSSYIKVFLRKDLKWSDGKSLTAADVQFSFDIFSDPDVQSRIYGMFINLETDEGLKIKPEVFEVEDTHTFNIRFKQNAVPSLVDIDVPVLPAHIFGSLKRDEIIQSEKDIKPVTCGPYKLKSWSRNQSVILEKNPDSFLFDEDAPDEIIFRIIPDYNSRLIQLGNGEIHLVEDIRIDDIKRLRKKNNIRIDFIKGREYDYIGWNNLDPKKYSEDESITPHSLFSNREIRKALTMAVDRQEILNDYLMNYGEIAASPVSYIFSEAVNRDIKPVEYNPSAARELLRKNGWIDRNRNSIVDKDSKEFSFTLSIPSGNPRREFAAIFIRSNLKVIGVDVKIEQLEPSVFFEKMFNKELDAWIAGWIVPIPPDLKPFWYSDFKIASLNVAGFRNSDADFLLNAIEEERNHERRNLLLKEVQQVIYQENPVTFLYWIDNVIAFNNKLQDVRVSPLGILHNIWEWRINE